MKTTPYHNLGEDAIQSLIDTLRLRFSQNRHRHTDLPWETIEQHLLAHAHLLAPLHAMETSGGEPDVLQLDPHTNRVTFYDCSPESPAGRRSLCYDQEALDSRKANKPIHSAQGMALEMGVTILTELQYFFLQQFGPFDTKTSSWISTPPEVRTRGGGLFGDWRFGRVFIYHNGAESYYGARGFRASYTI